MATGANAAYWEDHRLPGVLKLNLLRRYLPVFLIRTSKQTKHVAYIDGFAGRGTYGDGSLGSPGIMMEFAAGQKFGRSTDVDLHLCEKDGGSFADLTQLSAPYLKKGLAIDLTNGDAAGHLSVVLPRVAALPTFIFEDPTGLGVPYRDSGRGDEPQRLRGVASYRDADQPESRGHSTYRRPLDLRDAE